MNNELERMREDNNHYHEQAQVAGAKINDYEKRIAELHLPWRILEYGDGATINNGYRDNIGRIWNTDNAIAIVEAVNAAPELRQRIAELEAERDKTKERLTHVCGVSRKHLNEVVRLREENERLLAAINGCDAGYRLKDAKIDELEAELERMREGIAIMKETHRATSGLLEQRQRVLNAIPDCPTHGANCVPHAIEWIHQAKTR